MDAGQSKTVVVQCRKPAGGPWDFVRQIESEASAQLQRCQVIYSDSRLKRHGFTRVLSTIRCGRSLGRKNAARTDVENAEAMARQIAS